MSLGDRTKRKKARPSKEVGGWIRLSDAWDKLTPVEFGIWLRLAAEGPEVLDGREALASRLGYTPRWLNAVLRELSLKGFVEFIPGANQFERTRIVIKTQPATSRRDHFIRV